MKTAAEPAPMSSGDLASQRHSERLGQSLSAGERATDYRRAFHIRAKRRAAPRSRAWGTGGTGLLGDTSKTELSDCFNGSPGWNRTNDQRINSQKFPNPSRRENECESSGYQGTWY